MMARPKKGRPYTEDCYWFLRDLVRQAIDDTDGGLSGVCELVGCEERGRKSISNWLDDRPNAEGVRKQRALRDEYAVALMKWLSASKDYGDDARELRKKAIDWFDTRLSQKSDRIVPTGMNPNWLSFQWSSENIKTLEEEELQSHDAILRAFWYVDRYLGV